MSPLLWVWLDRDWRRWAAQVRTVPPGACLVAPRPNVRNRVLALTHQLGRGELRILLQSEVTECLGLWRMRLAIRGMGCVAAIPDVVRQAEGFRGQAVPQAQRQEIARPGGDSEGRRAVPVWARAAGARRRRIKALAAAGVVSL